MKYLSLLFVLSLAACSESTVPAAFNMEVPPDMDGGVDAGPTNDDDNFGGCVAE